MVCSSRKEMVVLIWLYKQSYASLVCNILKLITVLLLLNHIVSFYFTTYNFHHHEVLSDSHIGTLKLAAAILKANKCFWKFFAELVNGDTGKVVLLYILPVFINCHIYFKTYTWFYCPHSKRRFTLKIVSEMTVLWIMLW